MARHWNMSFEYVRDHIGIDDWYPCLIVALTAWEMERRQTYALALGDPEKYEPVFAPERAEGEPSQIVTSIFGWLAGGRRPAVRGNLAQTAKMRPDLVQQVQIDAQGTVLDAQGRQIQMPDGAVIVDAQGQVLKRAATREETQLDDIVALFGVGRG